MAIGLVADRGSVAVEIEATEGVYQAEQAGASFLEVLSEGLEFSPSKELIERNNRTSTVETVASRVGQKSMAGSIPVEFRAGDSEGQAPEFDALLRALMGGKRTGSASISKTGHTNTVIEIEDADISKYNVGDIVKVKEYDASAGADEDHVSPIVAVDDSIGAASITLLVPYSRAFSDAVEIGAFTTYYHSAGAPTLSITNYLGGEIREKAIGMRATQCDLNNFSTGALPDLAFSLEGLDFDREVGQPLFTPAYPNSLPPIVLCSKVYRNSDEIEVNNVGFSIVNTLAFLTSTASCSGKIKSRITNFAVSGSLNPYMQDNDVVNFDFFNDNTPFAIFGSSANYGASNKEKIENVCFYMPKCISTEIATGNEDGVLTDAITFSAHKNLGNDTMYLGFI
jgi:hypothetical protein